MMNAPGGQSLAKGFLFRPLTLFAVAGLGVLLLGFLVLASWSVVRVPFVGPSPGEVEALRRSQVFALSKSLTRLAYGAERDTIVEVLFATPEYLRLAGGNQALARYQAEGNLVFLLTEENHIGLSAPSTPLLRFLGEEFPPASVKVLVDSDHHRTSVVTYREEGELAHLAHAHHLPGTLVLEMIIAPGSEAGEKLATVAWQMPLASSQAETGGFRLSGAALLGLFGGLLASMWPCLFQLTAYFIPSLAGLSLAQANKGVVAQLRLQVLKTALFFVLGIVIVYTLAGAVAGYAAQSLAGTALFESWRRPITLLAAVFIIVMALRVAVRARAPLVCKMPLATRLGGKGPTSLVGTMALGLAFATGCMTCFGAAMALGMLTYVVSSASAITGAITLFLFSLGIAIPLVVAAVAMAQVLPLLGRLERIAPWMALASSTIMVSFALLLISDQYHIVSGWILRSLGG